MAAYEVASGRVKTHFGGEERGGAVGSGTAPCRTAAVSLVKALRAVWEPPVPEPGPTLPPVEARRAAWSLRGRRESAGAVVGGLGAPLGGLPAPSGSFLRDPTPSTGRKSGLKSESTGFPFGLEG